MNGVKDQPPDFLADGLLLVIKSYSGSVDSPSPPAPLPFWAADGLGPPSLYLMEMRNAIIPNILVKKPGCLPPTEPTP